MATILKQEFTVKTDGIIEIHSQNLKKGAQIEIIIHLKETQSERTLCSFIGHGKGCYCKEVTKSNICFCSSGDKISISCNSFDF